MNNENPLPLRKYLVLEKVEQKLEQKLKLVENRTAIVMNK